MGIAKGFEGRVEMVEITFLEEFKRQAKAFNKKYKSFSDDFESLLNSIKDNPFQGTSLGEGVYKVRMKITSKGKGKRGGAIVLTWTVTQQGDNITVTLLAIYDKSEYSNVSDRYIKSLVKEAVSQL